MNQEVLMQRCLDLAQQGADTCRPNPMVGALLYHKGHILAEGWHGFPGGPHAEVNCFNACTTPELLGESTLFVSLEPCAHHGKTPPCADLVIARGVQEVVIAMQDPNPLVAGQGLKRIQEAGIRVQTGVLEREARWLNRRFICFHEQQRPYLTLKWAEDANGNMGQSGKRISISHPHLLPFTHQLRARHQAILIGKNTLITDRPLLNTRHWHGPSPLPIILDRHLETLQVHPDYEKALIINSQREDLSGNLKLIQIAPGPDFWQNLMQRLYQLQVQSVLVEGGASILQSLLDQGWGDEIIRIQASKSISSLNLPAPKIHERFSMLKQELIAADLVTHYRIA